MKKRLKKFLSGLVLFYLRIAAKIQLAKIRPKIIGVAGACGKTSLCQILATLLQTRYQVRQTQGLNSETGIPLAILGLRPKNYSFLDWLRLVFFSLFKVFFDWEKYEVLVAEMGIDSPWEPKNMTYLFKIIRPQIGILTNLSLEHSENFDQAVFAKNTQKKREEILSLTFAQYQFFLSHLSQNGVFIFDLDEPGLTHLDLKDCPASLATVSSQNPSADFYLSFLSPFAFFQMKFSYQKKIFTFQLSQPLPKKMAKIFLLAFAAAEKMGLNLDQALSFLAKNFSLPPGRMSLFPGIKGSLLIDSSYNALPSSMVEMLEFLKEAKGERKIAVLGDLLELGSQSKTEHQKIAPYISSVADVAVLIGPQMRKYVAPFLQRKKKEYYSFLKITETKSFLKNFLQKGDIVLIKGYKLLESVVEELLAEEKDKEKLCRRGSFWDKKRHRLI